MVAQHRFVTKTFTQPTFCADCGTLLLGFWDQGKECTGCKRTAHFHCVARLEKQARCKRGKAMAARATSSVNLPMGSDTDEGAVRELLWKVGVYQSDSTSFHLASFDGKITGTLSLLKVPLKTSLLRKIGFKSSESSPEQQRTWRDVKVRFDPRQNKVFFRRFENDTLDTSLSITSIEKVSLCTQDADDGPCFSIKYIDGTVVRTLTCRAVQAWPKERQRRHIVRWVALLRYHSRALSADFIIRSKRTHKAAIKLQHFSRAIAERRRKLAEQTAFHHAQAALQNYRTRVENHSRRNVEQKASLPPPLLSQAEPESGGSVGEQLQVGKSEPKTVPARCDAVLYDEVWENETSKDGDTWEPCKPNHYTDCMGVPFVCQDLAALASESLNEPVKFELQSGWRYHINMDLMVADYSHGDNGSESVKAGHRVRRRCWTRRRSLGPAGSSKDRRKLQDWVLLQSGQPTDPAWHQRFSVLVRQGDKETLSGAADSDSRGKTAVSGLRFLLKGFPAPYWLYCNSGELATLQAANAGIFYAPLDQNCFVDDSFVTNDDSSKLGLFALFLSGREKPFMIDAKSAEKRKQWVSTLRAVISDAGPPQQVLKQLEKFTESLRPPSFELEKVVDKVLLSLRTVRQFQGARQVKDAATEAKEEKEESHAQDAKADEGAGVAQASPARPPPSAPEEKQQSPSPQSELGNAKSRNESNNANPKAPTQSPEKRRRASSMKFVPPLSLPYPSLSTHLRIKAKDLFNLLYASEEFYDNLYQQEGVTNVVREPWSDKEITAGSTRSLSYRSPRKGYLPPNSVEITITCRQRFSDGYQFDEVICNPSVPYGKSFRTHRRTVFHPLQNDSNMTALMISCDVEFTQSVFVKRMIIGTVAAENSRYLRSEWLPVIQKHHCSEEDIFAVGEDLEVEQELELNTKEEISKKRVLSSLSRALSHEDLEAISVKQGFLQISMKHLSAANAVLGIMVITMLYFIVQLQFSIQEQQALLVRFHAVQRGVNP